MAEIFLLFPRILRDEISCEKVALFTVNRLAPRFDARSYLDVSFLLFEIGIL